MPGITRRTLLSGSLAASGMLLAAACGTIAPVTTPTDAPKTEAEPTAPSAAAPKAERKVLNLSNYHGPEDARWIALRETLAVGAESLGIEINPVLEFQEVLTRRNTEFAAGTTNVDITYNQVNWVIGWGLNGVIEDLTPYFARGPRAKSDYFAGELVNWSWGPALYGVPFQSGGECFMVNKDKFNRAGIELPPKDWSYDDLLDISSRLTNAEQKEWGLIVHQNYVFYMMGTYMYNFGGQVLNETKDQALYGTDPNSLAAAQYNIDLAQVHQVIPPPEIQEEIPQGSFHMEQQFVAMENNGIYRHNSMRKVIGEDLDFLAPPMGAAQTATVIGNAYSIMSLSEQKDLAWDFLMWFHSDESMLETPHFGSIAWPPVIEYSNHPKWLEPFEGTRIRDVLDVWETAGHDAMIVPEGSEAWTIDIEWTKKAVSGEITVPEAYRQSAEQMNELFSRRPAEWKMG